MSAILSLVVALAPAAWAGMMHGVVSDEANPEAYWGRGFGCSQASDNYQINLEVVDLEAATSKAEALVTAAGGPSRAGMHDGMSGDGRGTNRRYRQVNYLMPTKLADKVAKKMLDVGELTNYQLNKQGADVKPLAERITKLSKELAENKTALEQMPAAKFFLTSRLNSLKQTMDTCEQAVSKAAVILTLREKAENKTP